MFKPVFKLLGVLNRRQRRQFLSLQILVFFSGISELAGIASIAPFMTLASNPEVLSYEGHILNKLYQFSGTQSQSHFLVLLAVVCFLALLIGSVFSTLVVWRISLFATSIGVGIGDRLFDYYLRQPYMFHINNNSAELIRRISTDTNQVSMSFIMPILHVTSKLVPSIMIIVALLYIDFAVTVVGVFSISLCYAVLIFTIRRSILIRGHRISDSLGIRFKLMSEGLGAIKDIIILNRFNIYSKRFRSTGSVLARSLGENQSFTQAPRYILELVAVGSILLLIVFMLIVREESAASILPILSLYAIAGFKLLPNFQLIYTAFARIRGSIGMFENIYPDLLALRKEEQNNNQFSSDLLKVNNVRFFREIGLQGVFFRYSENRHYSLKDVNLRIFKNSSVGIVGPSGSGKSTIVDIMLGLLQVDKGKIVVDNLPIDFSTYKRFVNQEIAYVPQDIYLTDDSIRNNIAFGLRTEDIDNDMIERVCELSCLNEVIDLLDEGVDTIIGERGVQLSGGQRQRIGIARALYNNAKVLILDEATSALDNTTERNFMQSLKAFKGNLTIIIVAHRLSTVEHCDIIYYIQEGVIVDFGNYKDLLKSNEDFRKMVEV